MHDHECKEQLYRETARSSYSQEGENCGAVRKHGVIISATSTGNRVVIDMFATTDTSLKTNGEIDLQLGNEAA
jgi:hypothetical protein